eukprot:TRINITY_DN3343_c0_g1_i3.p1 TRINITY_DN3343_c0_g1~~TRINITY_DN3343_c0_g1_i3.p1  ORF type:complete len:405 (+),score=35.28 TRINITY_DN3343_c0_g1_i3:43-1257(+)
MACCFRLFYGDSSLQWEESAIANAIIRAADAAHKQASVQMSPLVTKDYLVEVPAEELLLSQAGTQLRVVEYAPRVFKHFREDKRYGNNISYDAWKKVWTDTMNKPKAAQAGSGKSGASFILSAHNHYMIKTITKREAMIQKQILKDYISHFSKSPNSFLMRHLMLLRVEEIRNAQGSIGQTQYFLIFENVNDVPINMQVKTEKWDLKGRIPKPGKLPHVSHRVPKNKIGTDKDLMRNFKLSSTIYKQVVELLKHDTVFLQHHNLMDYSLFLCIVKLNTNLTGRKKIASSYDEENGLHPETAAQVLGKENVSFRQGCHKFHNGVLSADCTEVFYMGVIDCLTDYHKLKKLANCCKQFTFFEQQLSTIPSEAYGKRFYSFMSAIFQNKTKQTTIVGAPGFEPTLSS